MIISNINNYKNGWIVGDFTPAIYKNSLFEVAIHNHKKNEETFPHYHKITKELNLILEGTLKVSDHILSSGDIWIYEENEISNVEFITDCKLLIVRWPSIPSDKYFLEKV